ncbi:MAG: MBL fold metallo-hydrolase [bacterium]
MRTSSRFIILGSSSGLPQADRATAGYALEVEGRLSLIDCGGGVTSSFLKCGLDPLAVDRIFISHTHPDHCCELPLFIQLVYLVGRQDPLDIYVPDEFVRPLLDYLRAVYLIPEKMPFELNVSGYGAGWCFDEAFRLTALANRHLEGYRDLINKLNLPNRMQSHSFVLEVDGVRLYYSADVRDVDDVLPHLATVDIAVVEVTHLDLSTLFSGSSVANIKRVVLTHLGTSDEIDGIKMLIAKHGLDNVSIAHDGMIIPLSPDSQRYE